MKSTKKLIRNTIRQSVHDSLKDTPTNKLTEALFHSRICLEEELNSITKNIPNWETETRKLTLTTTIGMLLSNEPTIEELLTQELEIEKPTLLELTLNNMKNETSGMQNSPK